NLAPGSLPAGTVGTPYSQTITVTGGTPGSPPYSALTVTNFSSGGTGLSVTPNAAAGTVAISGTPSGAGTASFTANVTDAAGVTVSAALSVVVTQRKVNQTISFGPLGNKALGDPDFPVSATASSGLPV